jgi:hypothetical protein
MIARAISATDILGHHANVRLLCIEYMRQFALEPVHALTAGEKENLSGFRVVITDRRTRFHGDASDAVVHNLQMHPVRGRLEGRRDRSRVAFDIIDAEIMTQSFPQHRCIVIEGRENAGDRRQWRIIDDDLICGVQRLCGSVRDDHGDDLANMPDLFRHDRVERREVDR